MVNSWIKKVFSSFSSKKKPKYNKAQPSLEFLESRVNPARFANQNNVLQVFGTNGNDNISITLQGTSIVITADSLITGSYNGTNIAPPGLTTVTIPLNTANFAGMSVDMLDGNDTLTLNNVDFTTLAGTIARIVSLEGGIGTNNLLFSGIISSSNNIFNINNFSLFENSDVTGAGATLRGSGGQLKINAGTSGAGLISIAENSLTPNTASPNGSITFAATGNGSSISLLSQVDLYQTLTINGTSNASVSSLVSNNSFTVNNKATSGDLVINTNGQINFNNIKLSNNTKFFDLNVQNFDSFTSFGDVVADNISFTSSTNNSSSLIDINGFVFANNNFSINSLGGTTSGANVRINSNDLAAPTLNNFFFVGGNFNANKSGLYNLAIYGQTSQVFGSATISNQGTLTLGNINYNTTPPNNTFTVLGGDFDASASAGPSFLFADIFARDNVKFSNNITYQAANNAPFARQFSITANTGNITVNGEVALLDANASTNGSDLNLSAINGNITVGSITGPNRTMDIKSINFSSDAVVQLNTLNITGTGLNSGIFNFKGNVGASNVITRFVVNPGNYDVQLRGSANYFGPLGVLTTFNNTGKVVLGDNSADNISFIGGGAFVNTVTVAGTGIVSGLVTIQGAITPGNYTFIDGLGNTRTNNVGILTFQDNVNFEDASAAPLGQGPAIFYADVFGQTPGFNLDQIVANSGFVLINNPILFPIARSTSLNIGDRLNILKMTSGNVLGGKFSGLVNPATNTYQVLNEGDIFYAGGSKYQILYTAGDGNDVVVTFLGYGSGTNVFVDFDNNLNIIGTNQINTVNMQFDSTTNILTISDTVNGLFGFAYNSKAVNNVMNINILNPNIGFEEFNGLIVQLNSGSDSFTMANVDFVQMKAANGFIDDVFFSLNGGPSQNANLDTDTLILTGTNQNISNSANSTVNVLGFDVIGTPLNGSLISNNNTVNSMLISGPIFYNSQGLTGTITIGSESGTTTLANNAFLSNGMTLNLGNGSNNSNLITQNIYGTPGGIPSNLTFNVQEVIDVNGSIGTDIGVFTLANSGVTTFLGSVDASDIIIKNNDGGINFKGVVGFNSNPEITIEALTIGSVIKFSNNLYASVISTSGSNNTDYGIQFLGNITTVTKNTSLSNIGGIVLGDSNDVLTFKGGLDINKNSPVEMYGTIQSEGTSINILSNAVVGILDSREIGFTLTGPSLIQTTSGTGNSAPIALGRFFSNTYTLTVDSGTRSGSTIGIDEVRGNSGNLIIINSSGATIGPIGVFSDGSSLPFKNEIFGTIEIRNSINDIVFKSGMLLEKIITTNNPYNIIIQGIDNPTLTNGFSSTWLNLILDTNPTVFRNRGNVTFGANGNNPFSITDYFMFNGGVDTSLIGGVANVGSSLNANNKDIIIPNINVTTTSLINTYFGSKFRDGFFLNPVLAVSAGGSKVNITANLLDIFGYTDAVSLQNIDLPDSISPTQTGNMYLGSIVNTGNSLSLNAGGMGKNNFMIGGDIHINSYTGKNSESLRLYRANNISFEGAFSATNLFVGAKANGNSSTNTELLGTVSFQGNFDLLSQFRVSEEVNNVAILGATNNIYSENAITNTGFLQLGNGPTDQFNIYSNLPLAGPSDRRLGGIFNIFNSRVFDLGAGPITLVADTVSNTNGIGYTSIGSITNNQFDLTINGLTQIVRYGNSSALTPYPTPTNPPSYVPLNNVIGAGTGGGNTIFNGEVTVQTLRQSSVSEIKVNNTGSGYSFSPAVTFQGGGGSNASATATLQITALFGGGGSGYTVGDTINIGQGSNYTASATVTAIGTNNAITAVSVSINGTGVGYTDLSLLLASGGTGNGAVFSGIGRVTAIIVDSPGSGYSNAPQVFLSDGGGIGASASAIISSTVNLDNGNIINLSNTDPVYLKKQGSGDVFLNTDSSLNTSSLVTTIERGAFYFNNGKLNSDSTTVVANGGLIGGSFGSMGNLTVLANSNLSPGNASYSIGVLNTVGNLNIQGNYNVDVTSQSFGLYDRVNHVGTIRLTNNGVSGVLKVLANADANINVGDLFGIISNDGTDAIIGTFTNLPEGSNNIKITLPNGNVATAQITYKGNITPTGPSFTGGNDVVLKISQINSASSSQTQSANFPNKLFAVSTDAGGGPVVKINFDNGTGFEFYAYSPTFTGGVRIAIGDINGDGQPDLVTAAGAGGGPHVIVWSINTNLGFATVQSSFFAFSPNFTGGLTLATGKLNTDNFDDIIVGAGPGGGPAVKAFAGSSNFVINANSPISDFFAYDASFRQGVNVAAGDRTGDGLDEIITGAAQGGGPHVQVFNTAGQAIDSFFAFSPSLTCGVFVGAGDLDSDGLADIYTGTGSGTIGTAGVFFGNGRVTQFQPFGQFFYGGVRVGAAIGPVNQTGNTSVSQNFLLTAAGPGGGPQVSIFDGFLNQVNTFFAFPQNFTGGVLASTTVNR